MSIVETIIKQQGENSTTVQAMRQFFPIIEQAEAELRTEYSAMLAKCRDAFPIPACGSDIEQQWAAAMACPSEVAAFVEKAAAELQAERDRLQVALEHCLLLLPEDCSAAGEARAALNQQERP